MAQQTPRGIPIPESTDPDNVPAYFQLFASFLDPGQLQAYNPSQANTGRIVFLIEGDQDPVTKGVTPTLGTLYLDRSTARLWFPFTELVNGVNTLGWYRVGSDADAEIAALAADQIGMVRTGTASAAQIRSGQLQLQLTGVTAGTPTQGYIVGVAFPEPFSDNTVPQVTVSNVGADTQPNVVLGVQNVTNTGFQVQVTRSDVPFYLNDTVVVDYIAVGQ